MELEAICLDSVRRPRLDAGDGLRMLAAAELPPPFLDVATLAGLSGASRTRHLVDLVMNLQGFEHDSAECASRDPDAKALHLDLQRAAGPARSIIALALERVATADGIALPPLRANDLAEAP